VIRGQSAAIAEVEVELGRFVNFPGLSWLRPDPV